MENSKQKCKKKQSDDLKNYSQKKSLANEEEVPKLKKVLKTGEKETYLYLLGKIKPDKDEITLNKFLTDVQQEFKGSFEELKNF